MISKTIFRSDMWPELINGGVLLVAGNVAWAVMAILLRANRGWVA